MDEDPTTQELQIQQIRREEAERIRAEQAREAEAPGSDSAADAHERRADKSAYLRRKLEEREAAEREAERGG